MIVLQNLNCASGWLIVQVMEECIKYEKQNYFSFFELLCAYTEQEQLLAADATTFYMVQVLTSRFITSTGRKNL